jgi:hypothetical protein
VATETFIAEGYRGTQMADVAEAHEPLPETTELPIKTPVPGDTVKRL